MTTETERRSLRQIFTEGWNQFWDWETWPWPQLWDRATTPTTYYVSVLFVVAAALTAFLWAAAGAQEAQTAYLESLTD